MNRKGYRKNLKSAVALKYTEGVDKVPVVSAKGEGRIAESILELAREHNIPVREDPDLIEL
ncbi:MAG: EscU/YscU/HrcU family type III secretion system export apparatus switch protein, partial [Fibrobacteres bacterium]|nr:EscU/YscU/HrcU family type III secretion system export apparatus switch protein [Fibrobacterota bacterium]